MRISKKLVAQLQPKYKLAKFILDNQAQLEDEYRDYLHDISTDTNFDIQTVEDFPDYCQSCQEADAEDHLAGHDLNYIYS